MTSNFKRALAVLAITAGALLIAKGALAQTQATTANVQNGLTANASIAPGAIAFNQAAAPAITSGQSNLHVEGYPAMQAASSFSTPAVWRCATSGEGFAVQAQVLGITHSGKGGESVVCAADFRIGLVRGIDAMTAGDEQDIARRIACNDEQIADAWEDSHPCADPSTFTERRKHRWDSERQARATMAQ